MVTSPLEPDPVDLHEKLAQTQQALERADRLALAGRFAASIMHEINGPLEAVTNFAYLMRAEPLPPAASEYLELIEEQLRRLRDIAHQTLFFYRPSQGRQSSDLVLLIGAALRAYSQPIADKRIAVKLELPRSAYYDVFPVELTQAVSNLISNAIDASEKGGRLRIRLRPAPGAMAITVGDCGTGVPQHIRKTLFQAFASGKAAGHGLGLWISQRAVEKHGGRIAWRTSTVPGRSGTTFRISLGSSRPVAHAA